MANAVMAKANQHNRIIRSKRARTMFMCLCYNFVYMQGCTHCSSHHIHPHCNIVTSFHEGIYRCCFPSYCYHSLARMWTLYWCSCRHRLFSLLGYHPDRKICIWFLIKQQSSWLNSLRVSYVCHWHMAKIIVYCTTATTSVLMPWWS